MYLVNVNKKKIQYPGFFADHDMKLHFYDCSKPLYIEVDTSKKGIGAVMLQEDSI